jgi:hypothetical protein
MPSQRFRILSSFADAPRASAISTLVAPDAASVLAVSQKLSVGRSTGTGEYLHPANRLGLRFGQKLFVRHVANPLDFI